MVSASAIITAFNTAGNLGNLVRDMFDSHGPESAGHYHNYMATVLHPQGIALDIAFTNGGQSTAVVALDGVRLSVSAGQTLSLTNSPFTEVRVIQGTNISYVVQGIYVRTLEAMAKRRMGRELSVWQ